MALVVPTGLQLSELGPCLSVHYSRIADLPVLLLVCSKVLQGLLVAGFFVYCVKLFFPRAFRQIPGAKSLETAKLHSPVQSEQSSPGSAGVPGASLWRGLFLRMHISPEVMLVFGTNKLLAGLERGRTR